MHGDNTFGAEEQITSTERRRAVRLCCCVNTLMKTRDVRSALPTNLNCRPLRCYVLPALSSLNTYMSVCISKDTHTHTRDMKEHILFMQVFCF